MDANGNWDLSGNWTNATTSSTTGFPNTTGESVLLGDVITADRVLTLGQNITIGKITFADDNGYTVAGSTLTLTSDTTSLRQNGSGTVTINSDVVVQNSTIWSGNGSGVVTLNGNLTDNGGPDRITKDGSFTLVVNGTATHSGWTVNAGMLEFGSDAASGPSNRSLILDGGAIRAGGGARTLANSVDILGNFTVAGSYDMTLSGSMSFGSVSRVATISNSGVTTFSGVISGSAGLTKQGSGTLVLSGDNRFDGEIVISTGVINVRHRDALGGTGNSVSGTVVNTGTALEVQGAISIGSETLTLSGTGISSGGALRNISDVNSMAGAITLASNTRINSDSGSLTLSGGISGSGRTLTAGGAGDVIVSGAITTGTGGLVKDGAGTLTLSGAGANTFSGATTINAGTVDLQKTAGIAALSGEVQIGDGAGTDTLRWLAANQISDSATLTLASSGVANLNGFSETVAGLNSSSAGAVVNLGAGTLTVGGSGSSTYAGSITGTGGLTKSGAGSLTLSGASAYSGATLVASGVLNVQNSAALGTVASGVTVSSGAELQLVGGIAVGAEGASLSGTGVSGNGALRNVAGNNSWAGAISLAAATRVQSDSGTLTLSGGVSGAGQNLTVGGAGNVVLSGVIATGAGGLTKEGAGTLTLSGANTYTGGTTVSGGTLQLGASDVIADTSNLALNSATVHLGGNYSERIGTLGFANGAIDFGTTGTPSANYFLFSDDAGFAGVLTILNWEEGLDELAFLTANTLDSGFLDNIYFSGYGSGATTVVLTDPLGGYGTGWTAVRPSATFATWDGGAPGGAGWSASGGKNWVADSTPISSSSLKLAFDGSVQTTPDMTAAYTANTLRFNAGAASFTLTSSGGHTLTIGGALPSIIQQSANNQAIQHALALSGDVIVDVAGAGTLSISGAISGTGGIEKIGNNTLALSGANTFSGATVVRAGTLSIEHSGALGSTASGTTVLSGGTLALAGGIAMGAESLTLNGSGVSDGGALRNVSGNNSWAGAVTLGSATTLASVAGTMTLSGSLDNAGHALAVAGAGDIALTGVLSGAGDLNKSGAGTLTLAGSAGNTLSGTATVLEGTMVLNNSAGNAIAGALAIGDGIGGAGADVLRLDGANQISDSSAVTLAASGRFELNGQNETIGSLASASALAQVDLGTGTLTAGDAGSTTFAGVISGSGGLAKAGSGTLTLSGASTYTGATMVNAGALNLGHAQAVGASSGGVTVASGAALEVQGGIAVGAEALTLSGTGLGGNGALRNVSGNNSWAGTVTLGGATRIGADAGTMTFSGGIAGSYDLTVGGAGSVIFGGVIGTGTGTLTKDGAGGVTLEAANTFSGGVNLQSGTLTVGHDLALGSGALTLSGGALAASGSRTIGNAVSIQGNASISGSSPLSFSGAWSQSGGNHTLTIDNADATTFTGGIALAEASQARTLTLNVTGGSVTISGAITDGAGTGGLTLAGAGTVTLTAANTYTGATTVGGGTLVLGASERISNSSALSLAGGTLNLGGFTERVGTLSYDNGTLNFGSATGANYFMFSDDGNTPASPLILMNWEEGSREIAFESVNSVSQAFLDNIYFAGYGSVAEVSAGNQAIAGYGSQWTFLRPSTAAYDTWNGGDVDDSDWTSNSNWADGSSPPGGLTTRVAFDGSTRLNPNLDRDRSVNVLRFNATASSFTMDSSGGKTLSFVGTLPSLIQLSANNQAINNAIDIPTSTLLVDVSGAGSLTIRGIISGTGGLNKYGSGTLVLEANNSLSGAVVIHGGVINVQQANALGATSSGTTVQSGGALELQGGIDVALEPLVLNGSGISSGGALRSVSGANTWSGAITLGSGARIQADSGTLTLSGAISGNNQSLAIGGAGDVVLSGTIGTTTGTLAKEGSGSLTLSGATANTFTGETTLTEGTLILSKTEGVNAIAGGLTVGDGIGGASADVVRLDAAHQIADSAPVTVNASGELNLNGQNETIGSLTMTAGRVVTGAGALTLGGDVTGLASGSAAEISGSLNLGGATRTFSIADGAAVTDMEVSAVLSSGALTKAGAGTMLLSGANTYSGSTIINEGALRISHAGALGASSSGTTVNSGGALELAGSLAMSGEAVTLSGGGVSGGGALRSVSGNNSWSGALTLAANSTIGIDAGSLALNSAIDNGAHTVTFTGGGDATVNGSINGTGGLVKEGPGTLTLNGAANFAGNVTINQGTLLLGASDRIGNSTTMTLGGGTFATGGFDEQLGALTLTASSYIDLGASDSILEFGDSSGASWSENAYLYVQNWTGGNMAEGNGTDQLYFGNTAGGLLAGQLSQIYFVNPAGYDLGIYRATILSGGEVVPVPIPEPSTVITVGFLACLLGFHERRRLKTAFDALKSALAAVKR